MSDEPISNDDYRLTSGEVARLFKVDPKTVARWAKQGRVSSIRTPGRQRRYSRKEITALLEGGSPDVRED